MLLTDREWKEFNFDDITVKTINSKAYHSNDIVEQLKGIPYITRTSYNNGLSTIVKFENKYTINPSNTMSYGAENADFFYHEHEYITGNKMYYLKSDFFNKYLWLFLKGTLTNCIKDCFSFGYGMIPARLMRKKFLLPVNEDGNPDYDFMEAYVKDQVNKKKKEYLDYAKKTVAKLEYKEIPSLEEKEWGEFFISDICNIESGQDIYDAERIIGKTPYITSTASNNGIKYFVDNSNKTLEAGAISVNRNGSVGYCFYHKYNALYSNDCRKLRLIIGNNEYISIFITNRITQQREKYNYGYKMGTGRLKRQKILLPVNESGQPDYAYMEQYVKNIMNTQLNKYLCYSNL